MTPTSDSQETQEKVMKQDDLEPSFPPETAKYLGWASLNYVQAPSSKFLKNTLLGLLSVLCICLLLTTVIGLDVTVEGFGEVESSMGSREAVSYSSGMIAEVLKKTGEKVKKNEAIALLEDNGSSSEVLEENLKSVSSLLKSIETDKTNADSLEPIDLNLITIGLTDEKLLAQIADVELSLSNYNRNKTFVQNGMKQELEPLILQEKKLKEKLRIMKTSESSSDLKYLIDKTEESLGQIQTSIIKVRNSSGANVDEAKQDLIRSLRVTEGAIAASFRNKAILSPIDGVVAKIHKGPRSFVSNETVVASVVPENSDLVGILKVNSRDIGKIKQAQNVYFRVEAFPYEQYGVFEGKVVSQDLVKSDADSFMVRTSITPPTRYKAHPEHVQMIAGMKFSARVVVKRRSIFMHIVDSIYGPLRDYL